LRDRLDDGRRGVAEDQRPPRRDEVHVDFPVDVGDTRALATRDERRLPPDAAEGPHRAVDAGRHHLLRRAHELPRALHRALRTSLAASSRATKSRRVASQRKAAMASTRPSITDVTT